MNKTILSLTAVLATFAAGAQEQPASVSASGSGDGGQVSFIGDDVRIGIGIDNDGDLLGEYFHVFGDGEESAWIAEGYLGDKRLGLKLNYHWLSGVESYDDAVGRAEDARIRKLFIALDENEFDDRKATVGFGSESPRLFWGIYGMKSASGRRLINEDLSTIRTVNTFVEGNQVFEQETFDDTITRLFEQPYDYGVGARLGHYFENSMTRLRGGLDFEDGDEGAEQVTVSLGLEKYFANTGHSLALTAEHLQRSGPLVTDDSDTRGLLMYRYSFGDRYRPRQDFVERQVTVDEAETQSQPATRTERRPVQNRIELTDEAYFDFDRAFIRDDAESVLRDLVEQIKEKEIVSKINVVGHTCNIGTVEYNQDLSEQRARSAVDFLTRHGIDEDRIVWEARGELDPRYSNATEASRKRNRRVEIEFVSIEQDMEVVEVEVEAPESEHVKWVREPITDPAWISRALRNPVAHKRRVDTYRTESVEQQTRTTDPVLINTLPDIADDSAQTLRDRPVVIAVLANDSDEEGSLSVLSVTQPSNGMAEVNADDTVTYTPAPGFTGSDEFTYIAADADGAEGMATVTVTVSDPPIVAADDAAETRRNMAVSIDVLANDSGEGISLNAVGDAGNGTAVANNDGSVTYTPDRDFVGADSFTYTIVGPNANTAEATVSVTVAPFNRDPVAVDDEAETPKETPITIDALANDTDPDGDALTIISVSPAVTPFGTVEITADNRVLYTPNPGWWGGDEFTYTVSDGFGGQDSARVVLEVLF